jgi:hypothetical protein
LNKQIKNYCINYYLKKLNATKCYADLVKLHEAYVNNNSPNSKGSARIILKEESAIVMHPKAKIHGINHDVQDVHPVPDILQPDGELVFENL